VASTGDSRQNASFSVVVWVASVIAFFLSPGGDYVTGATIVADGGWNLVGPNLVD